MYSLINHNLKTLLRSIERYGGVDDYAYLIGAVRNTVVSTDARFQKTYRSYWRMYGAGLSENFCRQYFEYLEELKSIPKPDLETIAVRLYQIPANALNKPKLHFSFSTKLVHMLDPNRPVYDSQVARFYFLPNNDSWKFDVKLAQRLKSYEFLIREYARIIEHGVLDPAIDGFRKRFKGEFSNVKVIDTLIWRFVSMLSDGAVSDGSIKYE
jgi:hypothetical protein